MAAVNETLGGTSLGHMPSGKWAFDESVTAVFEDMLHRSIPEYEVMRKAVLEVGSRFVRPGTSIVDLGCSKGDALVPFVHRFGAENSYIGVEVSAPMLRAARERFRQEIEQGSVSILDCDLRTEYPVSQASLTLSVLTLQFVPIEHRQRVLRDAYTNTIPGGGFILVEKVMGSTALLNGLMVELYHDRKREAGYTNLEIERKRLSLEGVLVPVTARWNEELLRSAGFDEVDCFWRWMNFAAWVGRK